MSGIFQNCDKDTIDDVKNLITELVAPEKRHGIDILPEHITVLRGVKSKKQISRKKLTKKKRKLTRKAKEQLGLNFLPTAKVKYSDIIPLHELWKGYIKEHFSLTETSNVPKISDKSYDAFSKLLSKCDLHGAKISVIKSKCPSLIGVTGIIVMETKNTLKIVSEDNKVRTLPKTNSIFCITFDNYSLTIFGNHFTYRPAERSVRKIKSFINMDL